MRKGLPTKLTSTGDSFMTNCKAADLKSLTIGSLARLRAVGQVMRAKVFSMRLETRAGIKHL